MKTSMRIKFWGVRGSIPSPGESTLRYGGNTSCVSIEMSPDKILVFDSGTGIRELGKTLAADERDIYVLLTHNHWDHIQGFPFFLPIFQPDRRVYTFATPQGEEMICSAMEQMDGNHFPVTPDNLPSRFQCITDDAMFFLRKHGFDISKIPTNHPGGCYGYRIENNGRSVVYIPDNELEPPYKKTTEFDEFVNFCKNADVLIHDSQFLEADMPLRHGWGHSLVSQTRQLAASAEVKHLILFHHDPERTDKELDSIQKELNSWFKENGHHVQCSVGYEGLTLDLENGMVSLGSAAAYAYGS